VEKDVITSVRFVGSNGKSVTLPNMKVHIGPGPEDCDIDLSPIMTAVIINLLEKADTSVYIQKKITHQLKYGYNPEHQTFHTVDIDDTFVSKTGWKELSIVPSCLKDNYASGMVSGKA